MGPSIPGHDGWVIPATDRLWIEAVSFSPQYPDSGPRHDRLFWSYWRPDGGPEGVRIDAEPDMLGQFVDLAEAPADGSADDVLAFARLFGPLWRCQHGSYRRDPLGCPRLDPRRTPGPCGWSSVDREGEGTVWSEPVDVWRQWARVARGVLNVAAAQWVGRGPEPADMAAAKGRDDGHVGHFDLRDVLNNWLREGATRVGVVAGRNGLEPVTVGEDVFGALGVQLLHQVCGRSGTAFCRWCSLRFEPDREHRAYCARCSDDPDAMRARARERQRASRAKRSA